MREYPSTTVSTASGVASSLSNVAAKSVTNVTMHPAMPSPTLTVKEVPRKLLKVRKVKSEIKYVEPAPKGSSKKKESKKESKSDHEFANESDVSSQFRKQIYEILATYML